MKRVLVMMNRFIGDFLFMVPVLYLLRDHCPDLCLEILINKDCEGLVGPPLVDSVHAFDRTIRTLPPWRRLRSEIGFVSRFWRRPYDLVLDLAVHPRNAWIAGMARAERKVALGPLRGAWRPLVYTTVVPSAQARYETERFLHVPAAALGWEISSYLDRIQVPVFAEDLAAARRYLAGAGIAGRFVLCAPFSRGAAKYRTWPFENYGPVFDWLREEGRTPLVLAGPEDAGWVRQLREACAGSFTVVEGQTLGCVKGLMRLAEATIAIDTGILHLAAAVGARGVGLWGPTDPRSKTPALGRLVHLEKPYACRAACDRGGWEHCPDHRCLGDIGPQDVIAALQPLLGDPAASSGPPTPSERTVAP